MSSLKAFAAELHSDHHVPQNKCDMSVTPEVSHVEMWPYVASAAALSESHAATAVRMVASSAIRTKRSVRVICNSKRAKRFAAPDFARVCLMGCVRTFWGCKHVCDAGTRLFFGWRRGWLTCNLE